MKQDIIYALFNKQMQDAPEEVCVFDENRRLTRAEFGRLVDTIASAVPPTAKRVGLIMEHSSEMIAAIFAVIKGGRAYVPVEPFFPQERIDFMMQDANVDVIITNTSYIDKTAKLPYIVVDPGLQAEDVSFEMTAKPNDLAYILYTSGSTGNPKGVAVRNDNICHYVRAFQNEFHPNQKDIMLQYSVCSFDIFVEEVFTTLLSGAVLAIPSVETKKDIHSLMRFVETNNITEISGFPYLLLEMNRLPKIPNCLRLLISGGDVLRAPYITNLLGQAEIYNTYGPSETTVCASYYRCNDTTPLEDGTYPIGKGVFGTMIEILDEHLLPVKPGEAGEICILGGGVSAGYIENRRKENEAFVTCEDGSALYRSGDLGYYLPDGNIAFLHRKDSQVMIYGKRVEPIEVESVLCKCPEIKKAVVRPYTDEQNLSYMVAYIVLKQQYRQLIHLEERNGKIFTELYDTRIFCANDRYSFKC